MIQPLRAVSGRVPAGIQPSGTNVQEYHHLALPFPPLSGSSMTRGKKTKKTTVENDIVIPYASLLYILPPALMSNRSIIGLNGAGKSSVRRT